MAKANPLLRILDAARPAAVVPDDPRELVRAILAGRVTHADLTLDQLSWLARGVARARQHNFEKERDNG